MTAERKEKCRKALIGWLCVAALVSGGTAIASPLTTTAIAAEAGTDADPYDEVIDLSDLANASGSGFTVTSADKFGAYYKIEIQQSGTYKLTGSNYINNSYVDVEITAGSGVTANIVCDNAYIKNDNQDSILISGNGDWTAVTIFNTDDTGEIKLSGTLQVDTAESAWDLIGTGGNVSGQFFKLNYKKGSGNDIGTTYFLSGEGNTYKDQSGFSSPYPCVAYADDSTFDPDNITAAGEVICYDMHANNGTGKCSHCGEKIDYLAEIDLTQLAEYANNNPFGNGVEIFKKWYDQYYTIKINKSGSYKLMGSNCINDSYVDVRIEFADYISADVFCDDVYVKNPYGEECQSGSAYEHTDIKPFGGYCNVNFSGKMRVDTNFYTQTQYIAPLCYDYFTDLINSFSLVTYKNENGDLIHTTYYLKGGTYSDDSDILKDYRCISADGKLFDISNISGDSDVTVICSKDHTEGDGACTNCGKKIYTVAFGDSEEKVYDGELLENIPAAPAEEIGKKFAGWFDENGEEFDPTVPITGNVRYTAKFADRDVKKISLAEKPADSYIEGSKFDPSGLKLTVTYDDDREKVVEYSADDSDFEFLPALDRELTTADTKVSVSYRGSTAVDIPITVAETQVSGIKVKALPAKTSYIIGESVDAAGGKLTVSYNNGTSEDIDITAAMLTYDNTKAGEAEVTVTYGGFTDTFSVVFADKSVSGIKVKSLPTKTNYIVGESVDVTGGKLTVSYNNGTSEDIDITAAMLTYDNTKAGEAEVTVTYGVFTDTFSVTFTEPETQTVAAPAISPDGGTFIVSQKVTITCPTAGAVIYYTTDGTTPTSASTKYTGGFTITKTTTVRAIAVMEGMNDSSVTTAEFTRKISGGSSGSHRPTEPDTKPDSTPSIGGTSKSWNDILADIAKLPYGSTLVIELHGETTVPADVIKAVKDGGIIVEFVVDSSRSWIVDGSRITAVSAADLSILPGNADKSGLRGVTGADIRINDVGVPADLKLTFRKEFAGQFANLYKLIDGKLVFQSCVRVGENGAAIVSGADSAGEYVVMVCEFSDVFGDMSNDGVLDDNDSMAILSSVVGAGPGANPLMADFNRDGTVNALDASAILKLLAGV